MNMQQSEKSQYNKRFLKVSLLVLLLFSCSRSYKIFIEPRNEDVFYQHIKDSLDSRSVMAISAKDIKTLQEYVGVLNTMISVLNENMENFDNPSYVAKKPFLTDEGEIDFKDVSFYRLIYDPEHPLAETSGAEKRYVRYYSSNRKADDEACSYYRALLDAFEKAISEIGANIWK